jgi:hypothetical protein
VVPSVPKQNQNQWRWWWQVHLQWHPFPYQRHYSTHKTKYWLAQWHKFDITAAYHWSTKSNQSKHAFFVGRCEVAVFFSLLLFKLVKTLPIFFYFSCSHI